MREDSAVYRWVEHAMLLNLVTLQESHYAHPSRQDTVVLPLESHFLWSLGRLRAMFLLCYLLAI